MSSAFYNLFGSLLSAFSCFCCNALFEISVILRLTLLMKFYIFTILDGLILEFPSTPVVC